MPIILIVDDEQENLDALKLALGDENSDWQILLSRDENSALEMLRQQILKAEPVDVLLTDLVMTGEDSGMSLLREARKVDATLMAILFTAKEKSLDRYAAFDFGVFDVIEKNIRGASAVREINIKTRAALRYRGWSQRITMLGRYFDPKVFDALERNPELLSLNSRTVTIVFWDIRGFSRLCEILKPHPNEIADFLREYCDMAAESIFFYDGVLDKFVGDGVMALFGALGEGDKVVENGAVNGIKAAIHFRNRFDSLYAKHLAIWQLKTPEVCDIGLGCGIHTGDALVGNVGSRSREQFTALGSAVNFASRIENRAGKSQILASQTTERRARHVVDFRAAGEIDDLKNISGKFLLFEVQNTERFLL